MVRLAVVSPITKLIRPTDLDGDGHLDFVVASAAEDKTGAVYVAGGLD